MLPDYHMHTVLCGHAVGTVCQYRDAAARRGIPEICFTEHAPKADGIADGIYMAADSLPRYGQMVHDLQDGSSPTVLFGIEADYYPGCEEKIASFLSAWDFDLVLGSVHFLNQWGFDNPSEQNVWDSTDVPEVWRRYFELVGRMAKSGMFDVVAHVDLPKKFGHRLPEALVKDAAGPVLDAIAAAGMAIEINSSGLRRPVAELYPSFQLLALARERSIPVCFGSDAHDPAEVGAGFDRALLLARSAGYSEYVRFRKRKPIPTPLPFERSSL